MQYGMEEGVMTAFQWLQAGHLKRLKGTYFILLARNLCFGFIAASCKINDGLPNG